MASRWEEIRKNVPGQQDRDACKRDGTKDGRNQSLASAKARVHNFRFPRLATRRQGPLAVPQQSAESMLTIQSFRIHKDVTTALNKISMRGTHRPGSVETVPSIAAV